MKKNILPVLVAVGLIGSAFSAVLPGDLTNGLVAYYSFNGNGNDLSGNGNNIDTIGYSFVNDQNGISANAIHFSYGTSLAIPNSSSWDDNSFSVSLWAKFDSSKDPSYWNQLTGKRADYSLGAGRWVIADIGYGPGAANGFSYGGTFDYTGFGQNYISPTPTSQWNHIALTYTSNLFSFYINGSLVSQTSTSGSLNSALTRPIIIGGNGYIDATQTLNGDISDYMYYNTTLSSSQVSQLYSIQSVPEPSTYALFGLGALALIIAYRRKVA